MPPEALKEQYIPVSPIKNQFAFRRPKIFLIFSEKRLKNKKDDVIFGMEQSITTIKEK